MRSLDPDQTNCNPPIDPDEQTEASTTPVGAVAGHDSDLQPSRFATLSLESGLELPTLVSTIENTSHADIEAAENQVTSPDQIPTEERKKSKPRRLIFGTQYQAFP